MTTFYLYFEFFGLFQISCLICVAFIISMSPENWKMDFRTSLPKQTMPCHLNVTLPTGGGLRGHVTLRWQAVRLVYSGYNARSKNTRGVRLA